MNRVNIATSVDGYIADENNSTDWLHDYSSEEDTGFHEFMSEVDAVLMGKNTFDFVSKLSEDQWPYTKKVFVLSHSISSVPPHLEGKVAIVKGDIKTVVSELHREGFQNIYIDGGNIVSQFLNMNMVDDLTITRIPIILGKGVSLFQNINLRTKLEHIKTKSFNNGFVQSHYKVIK